MNYFNKKGIVFKKEIEGIVYRFIPGVNKNLPSGLEIFEPDLLPLFKEQKEILEIMEKSISEEMKEIFDKESLEREKEQEQKMIEDINKALEQKRLEFEQEKNSILLSDKTDRAKKMAITKLEKKYGQIYQRD